MLDKKCLVLLLLIVGVTFFTQAEDDKLTGIIIGSGSPELNLDRASASVYIKGGDTEILVDMGNGCQVNLEKAGIKPNSLDAILLTHHHLDHNEEFIPMLIRKLLGRDTFEIVGTPGTVDLVNFTLDFYKEDINYRLRASRRTLEDRVNDFTTRDIEGGESFTIGDIKISSVEVPHTIHTVAYRFDYNGQSIVISGDLSYTEALPELAKDVDYLIMDSGGMIQVNSKRKSTDNKRTNTSLNNKRGNAATADSKTERVRAHVVLSESSQMAAEAGAKNLIYTHFTKGTVDEEASLLEIRKNYSGNVVFGEDLTTINE